MDNSTIAKIYLGLVAFGLVVGVLIPNAGRELLICYGAVAMTLHVSSAGEVLLEDRGN